MKTIVLALSLIAISGTAHAQYGGYGNDVYHQGYETNRGTYVEPHYQTRPDNSVMDNYSTRGNVNPYTGQPGTVNPNGRF